MGRLLLAAILVLAIVVAALLAGRRGSDTFTGAPPTPHCYKNKCVECTDRSQCGASAPNCVGQACVADFLEYPGAWPDNQYGTPTAASSDWAVNALDQPPAATAEECAAACRDGCSGYEFDATLARCALWAPPAAAGTRDGSGTVYADAISQDTYAQKTSPEGGACAPRSERPCWRADSTLGDFDAFTATSVAGDAAHLWSVHINTLRGCAASCAGDSRCVAWHSSGSSSAGTVDGYTPINAGWCSAFGLGPSGCISLGPVGPTPGLATWYAGVRSDTPSC